MKTLGCTLILLIALIFLIKNKALTQITVTKQLRFDGMYNAYDGIEINVLRPNENTTLADYLVFMNGQDVFYNSHTYSLNMPDFQSEFHKKHAPKRMGKYTVVGDSIYATISTCFFGNGMTFKYLIAHYSGLVKNQDSIIGWRMIPPYPKIKLKLNAAFSKDTTVKTLYFVKYDKVKELEQYTK